LDSILPNNSQIKDPYSNFQVPPQQEELVDFEESMESMIQSEDSFTQSINMIEAKLSRLENMHRNKETLPTQSLTIPDTSSHIDENQESWYLEDYDQDSISLQNYKLDQYQIIDKFASFHSNEIELEDECDTNS